MSTVVLYYHIVLNIYWIIRVLRGYILTVLLFGKYFWVFCRWQSIFWVVHKYLTPLIPVSKYAKSTFWEVYIKSWHLSVYVWLIYCCCTGCPKKNFKRLIWCKLKTTAFTRSVFIFSKSSYLNLNFGIKQSKIGWKFAEQWLPKVKILEPVDDRRPDFSKNIPI